ncbi:MAG: nucleoside triphosphate pyrophosphohydrolase family protein [Nanoarchaeota archaeon]
MTFNEFQDFTATTAIYPKNKGLEYTILGLAGECGEICNKFKKVIRDDGGILSILKREDLIDELGDAQYYCASIARELGISLEEVVKQNVEKLTRRKENNTIKGSGDR